MCEAFTVIWNLYYYSFGKQNSGTAFKTHLTQSDFCKYFSFCCICVFLFDSQLLWYIPFLQYINNLFSNIPFGCQTEYKEFIACWWISFVELSRTMD